MPQDIHNCVQAWLIRQKAEWLVNGLITLQEFGDIREHIGTSKFIYLDMNSGLIKLAIEFPTGLFRGFVKEPDFAWRSVHADLPALVVETGWSESQTRLIEDMHNLFHASNGAILVVILVKWRRLVNGRVSGIAQLYREDPNGMPKCLQSEVCFSYSYLSLFDTNYMNLPSLFTLLQILQSARSSQLSYMNSSGIDNTAYLTLILAWKSIFLFFAQWLGTHWIG